MLYPAGATVTVRSTTTTVDEFGDGTTVTAESEWGPCAVWDRYATERTDPRVAPLVVGLMVAGPRVDIDADDRLLIEGVEYQVDGLPEAHTVNPFTGWDPGIVVPVKRAP